MRDRLGDLQLFLPQSPEEAQPPELYTFQGEEDMEQIYKEAQLMQKEIQMLKLDVKRLGKQNTRFLTSVRRISSIKRDSSALGRDIKARGGRHARLERLGRRSEELEEEHGAASAAARMARSQRVYLTKAFHEAMCEYNRAEMLQRENCKTRIQRQAEIVGREVSREQIEEMIETGKCGLFSDDLLLEGRGARSALAEIENRHKELLELEGRIRDIRELFLQMALLVEEQGCMLDNIQANVGQARDYTATASDQIRKAVRYKKSNPCKKIFCCCFPCCR